MVCSNRSIPGLLYVLNFCYKASMDSRDPSSNDEMLSGRMDCWSWNVDAILLLQYYYYGKNNGCDDFLFGVHCVEEGDRIPPLQSYEQALKQKNCFSGVLGDDCGASANLLD